MQHRIAYPYAFSVNIRLANFYYAGYQGMHTLIERTRLKI